METMAILSLTCDRHIDYKIRFFLTVYKTAYEEDRTRIICNYRVDRNDRIEIVDRTFKGKPCASTNDRCDTFETTKNAIKVVISLVTNFFNFVGMIDANDAL